MRALVGPLTLFTLGGLLLVGCDRRGDAPVPSSASASAGTTSIAPSSSLPSPTPSPSPASSPPPPPSPSPSTSLSGSLADAGAGASTAAEADAAGEGAFRLDDWELAIGKWTFLPNGEVETDGKGMSALMWRKGVVAKDLDVEVDVRFFTSESSAGVLFRATGKDFYEDATFYQFEWYTRGTHHDRRLSLMVKDPRWIQIVEPKYPEAPYEQWIRFRVRAIGDHLETFVDGERVFDRRDTRYLREGKIGLHCFMPRRVRFRRFRMLPP
jgi:hypothetical protein